MTSTFEFRIPDEQDPFYDVLRYFKKNMMPFPVTKEEWKKLVPYLIELVREAINQRPKDIIESYWRYDSQSPACSYSTYSFEWRRCSGLEHILSTPAPTQDIALSSRYMPPDFFDDYPQDHFPFVSSNRDDYDSSQYPQQKYDDGRKAMSYGFESIKIDPPPAYVLVPRQIYKAWISGLLGPVRITTKPIASTANMIKSQSYTDSSVNSLAHSITKTLHIDGSITFSNPPKRRRFTRPAQV